MIHCRVSTSSTSLSFLLSPESYQQLIAQSGWTAERYGTWLRAAVLAELTAGVTTTNA